MVDEPLNCHTVPMSSRGFKTSTPTATPAPGANTDTYVPTPSWQLLERSARLFWKNLAITGPVVIMPPLLFLLGTSLVDSFKTIDGWTSLGVLIEIIACVLLLFNVSATFVMQLSVVNGHHTTLLSVYRHSPVYLLRIVGFGMLFGLLMLCGILLLVFPALIVLRRYILVPYYIVDRNLGIRAAMHASAAASKPVRRHIWTMIIILTAFGVAAYGATKLPYTLSELVLALLPTLYVLLPALRYQELKQAGY
jgi:hypothetical protein